MVVEFSIGVGITVLKYNTVRDKNEYGYFLNLLIRVMVRNLKPNKFSDDQVSRCEIVAQ